MWATVATISMFLLTNHNDQDQPVDQTVQIQDYVFPMLFLEIVQVKRQTYFATGTSYDKIKEEFAK